MNKIQIIGRMTSDVEINASGKMASVNIAVDRPYPYNKDKDGNKVTDFFQLRFLGEKVAQRAKEQLTKGKKVYIEGIMCTDKYTSKDGEKKTSTYINCNANWELLDPKTPVAAQTANGFVAVNNSDAEELPFS